MEKPIKRTFVIKVTDDGKNRRIDIKRTNFGHHDLVGVLLDIVLKTILNPNIGQEKENHDYIG